MPQAQRALRPRDHPAVLAWLPAVALLRVASLSGPRAGHVGREEMPQAPLAESWAPRVARLQGECLF